MKRAKLLFDKIASLDNLELASRLASKGKKKRKNVKRFFEDKDKKLQFLHELLVSGKYHSMGYTKKSIVDRCSNKHREIFVPKFFPDQIVQWALILQIKPYLTRGMYAYSCASVEGRGSYYGYKYVKRILQDTKNTKYCLVMDIKRFYPSIDQDVLMDKFRKIIKDRRTIELIDKIVRSVPSGVPIGNYTSQWFANFFLQDYDHFVKERLHARYYVRYMDDMLLFCSSKDHLHFCVRRSKNFLKIQKLKIKPNYQVFLVANKIALGRAPDFLGYKFFRNFIALRGRTFLRARRRVSKVCNKSRLTAKDSSAILSYVSRINLVSNTKIYNSFVKNNINLGNCKKVVSFHDRQQAKQVQNLVKCG